MSGIFVFARWALGLCAHNTSVLVDSELSHGSFLVWHADRVPEREMGLSVERDLGESRLQEVPRNPGRVAEEVSKQVKVETDV